MYLAVAAEFLVQNWIVFFLDRLNQVDPLNAISVSYAWRSLHFKDIKRASLYCVR